MKHVLAAFLSMSVAAALTAATATADPVAPVPNTQQPGIVSAAEEPASGAPPAAQASSAPRRPAVTSSGSGLSREQLLEKINNAMKAGAKSTASAPRAEPPKPQESAATSAPADTAKKVEAADTPPPDENANTQNASADAASSKPEEVATSPAAKAPEPLAEAPAPAEAPKTASKTGPEAEPETAPKTGPEIAAKPSPEPVLTAETADGAAARASDQDTPQETPAEAQAAEAAPEQEATPPARTASNTAAETAIEALQDAEVATAPVESAPAPTTPAEAALQPAPTVAALTPPKPAAAQPAKAPAASGAKKKPRHGERAKRRSTKPADTPPSETVVASLGQAPLETVHDEARQDEPPAVTAKPDAAFAPNEPKAAAKKPNLVPPRRVAVPIKPGAPVRNPGVVPPAPGLVPASVHDGDFDGDGWLDLIVFWRDREAGNGFAHRGPSVFMSDHDGALTAQDIVGAADDLVRRAPGAVLVADFNGDGRDDVFVASGADAGAGEPLMLLMSAPDGRLHDRTAAALPDHRPWDNPGLSTWGAAMGDVDGDGDIDILIGTAPHRPDYMDEETSVRLLVNASDGRFFDATDALPRRARQPAMLAAGATRFKAISLEDFNGDGVDDLAIVAPTGGRSLVFLNAGFGDFTQSAPMELSERGLERMRRAAQNDDPRHTAALGPEAPHATAP